MNFKKEKKQYDPNWSGRRLLDKMAELKRFFVLLPIAPAAVTLLAFFLTADIENIGAMLIAAPIILALWYFGVFLVIILQGRNEEVNQTVLDAVLVLALAVFSIGAIALIIAYFFNISGYCSLGSALCALTVSSICLAHGKRD